MSSSLPTGYIPEKPDKTPTEKLKERVTAAEKELASTRDELVASKIYTDLLSNRVTALEEKLSGRGEKVRKLESKLDVTESELALLKHATNDRLNAFATRLDIALPTPEKKDKAKVGAAASHLNVEKRLPIPLEEMYCGVVDKRVEIDRLRICDNCAGADATQCKTCKGDGVAPPIKKK